MGLKGCLDVDVLSQCHYICILKHTLPVLDVRSISIQIPYYTNVRKLCRYYNMFESISFVMYNVESVLSTFYLVVWNVVPSFHIILLMDLNSWKRLLSRQTSPWAFSYKNRFFPILWVIRLHWYGKIVDCIGNIIRTCHSQYLKSAFIECRVKKRQADRPLTWKKTRLSTQWCLIGSPWPNIADFRSGQKATLKRLRF